MNNRFFFIYSFWPVELLVAAGVVFWGVHSSRAKPDGSIARLLRHRDRIWFALLVLFVPGIPLRYLAVHFVAGHSPPGLGSLFEIVRLFFGVFNGIVYGMAACWVTSPAKKEEQLGYGTTLMVAGALLFLCSVLSRLFVTFRVVPVTEAADLLAVLVIISYLISRAFVRKGISIQTADVAFAEPPKTEHLPPFTLIWLLVGLLPIPILLGLVASNKPYPVAFTVVVVFCALCNWCGGIGCLGRIKKVEVRAILGTFLGMFFFLLSWLIAAFEACSNLHDI